MTHKYESFEVEVGCGTGKFLVARAEENPHLFFIGIDKAGKWIRRGALKAEKKKLENLKFIKGEAREVIAILPPGSVSVFHIYFPDPWPKRRHHKRRLLTAEFLVWLQNTLTPKGVVEIATDDLDYFRHIKKSLAETNGAWKKIRETKNERLFPSSVITNYEQKYRLQEKSLYYLELQK